MRNVNTIVVLVGVLALCGASGGCLVQDKSGSRGQSNAPNATPPPSGSPVRRESPTETLNNAEPSGPSDVDVKVEKP